MDDDIANLDSYAATRFPAYADATFEGICADVIRKKQVQQLRNLIGFKFDRHNRYNWPEQRLDAIEKHIQKRIRHLLSVAR